MNCPKCGFGIVEYIGKSSLGLLHKSKNENIDNLNTVIPIDVYICSFEDCSHIEMKGRNGVLRKVKDTKRRGFVSKGSSL